MGRTMQTARKGARAAASSAVLDLLEIVAREDDFSLPKSIKPIGRQTSAAREESTPASVIQHRGYHVLDVRLPTLFDLVLDTLDVPKEEIKGKMREVLDEEAKANAGKTDVQRRKVAKMKLNAEMEGIELLDDHPVGSDADKSCLVFKEEQEIRIGVPLETVMDSTTGTLVFKEDSGRYGSKGPGIINAITAMVHASVGDHEKLFLNQSFCLKRQSDTFGMNVEGKSVVLDDEFQDTPLFEYRPSPYTDIERSVMSYASCIPPGETASRHWVDSLDVLLSTRNQHDQPFSTRIKLYLVNRPEPTDAGQIKDFRSHCPSQTAYTSYLDGDRGMWKSLRIGLIFEMYVDPAKMYIRPMHLNGLHNRRIIMQAVCPGPLTVRALESQGKPSGIKLEAFYVNLLPAPRLSSSLDEYQPEGMTATLLPFQLRTVAWLVDRERDMDSPYQTIGMWERLALGFTADAVDIAYNRITGEALPLQSFNAWNKGKGRSETSPLQDSGFDDTVLQEEIDDFGLRRIRGGMLCEEMGLGKTLEAIALIMLSRETTVKGENTPGLVLWDDELQLKVTKTQATLIVTPVTLIQQWENEIRRYAPGLKVVVYSGWKSVYDSIYTATRGKRKRDGPEPDEKTMIEKWVDQVSKADIVLTTFFVVQSDWAVALPPVKRSRRSTATYSDNPRPRSALLLCDWRRVVIDEIQELDIAAASNVANMIRTIKRRASLAISGTPAKASIEDLASSLLFLGVNIPNQIWKRITSPAFASTFHAIFRNIVVRHTKATLSPEDMQMTIPRQTRYLVPIKLNRIERAYYNDTFEVNIEDLQRSNAGFADIIRLRSVLHTLRMICTHMQVGQLGGNGGGRRATRIRLDNQIMTMMDALHRMEEDAESNFLSRLMDLGNVRIRHAMLLVMQSSNNSKRAASILQDVYREISRTLTDLETRIAAVEEQDRKKAPPSGDAGSSNVVGDREAFITSLRIRKTDLSFLQHEAAFRLGDLYSLESMDDEGKEEKEEEWYATAGRIRTRLLLSTSTAANSYRDRMALAIVRCNIKEVEQLDVDYAESLGLLGDRVQEPLNLRIDALKENAEFLWDVRNDIVERMLQAIAEDTADYAKTLDEQYELESQLWVYQMALADRREFMTEERNALNVLEDRPGGGRAAAERFEEPAGLEEPRDGAGPDPKEALIKQRDDIRRAAQEGMSLKAAQMELNEVAGRDDIRSEERILCKTEADRLKLIIKTQMDWVKKLSDEFNAFNACFNRRVAYFRALQSISDTVEPIALETDNVEDDLTKITERMSTARASFDKVNARRRYLESIRNEDETTAEGCPICQEAFGGSGTQEIVILGCLHRLCAGCYKTLRVKYFNPVCPNCRAEINSSDEVQKIAFRKLETVEGHLGKVDATDESAWWSMRIDSETFNIAPEDPEMLAIDILGNWGSKVNRLVRQIRFWRTQEPAVKHIIFSSWKDALTIVQTALAKNRIRYLCRTGNKNDNSAERFNQDPAIQVYLINGELQNSGLTLTSASVCHLLEPVINSAFEMQAIGRIDRLGQTRETTVYCYAAEETVDAKIVNRAKKNNTSLYAKVQGGDVVKPQAVMNSVARKGADDLSGNRDDILDLLLH